MPTVTEAINFASLAYLGPGTNWNSVAPSGWTYLTDSSSLSINTSNNYFGVAFQNNVTHEIVISSRGSTFTDSGYDWLTSDRDIAARSVPPAFADALSFAQQIELNYPGNGGVNPEAQH